MGIETIIQYLFSLSGLVGAIYTIYRLNKMVPYEQTEKDADASAAFATAASKVAEQVPGYLNRIEKLESKLLDFEIKVDKLEDTLRARDRCIDTLNVEMKKRDALIADWAKGIRILIQQLKVVGIDPAWTPADNEEYIFRPKN